MTKQSAAKENNLPQGHKTEASPPPARPYVRPILTRFGDVRDLTMSSSPGTGESGYPLLYKL